jgi:hypothetical protein
MSGYQWDGWEAQAARGSHCIYLAVQNGCAVVQWSTDGRVVVPSFRPSHAPCSASRLEHTAQFGTSEPCHFTDCGLVNLG